MQEHLLTFEQQWTDEASGRTLPAFVTEELHKYLECGILGRGFPHLYCESCGEHHVVAFSCKVRAVCPSCLGRRMSEGAANLVDHVLPDVPIRQFVLTQAAQGARPAGRTDRRGDGHPAREQRPPPFTPLPHGVVA